MTFVPIFIRKLLVHYISTLKIPKRLSSQQTVSYSAWFSNIFLFSALFFAGLLVFSIINKNSALFVYVFFVSLLSVSLLCYYYCKWWKVTINDNQTLTFRMPFRRTCTISIDDLAGYFRHDGEGIIYDRRGHLICTETIFVSPPILYNYFLEHKKIIHQRPSE